jgi:hydrogenase maturation protein HypF
VRGVVQGVGFRPFVYRIAVARGLEGWVLNGPDGVKLEVEGDGAAVGSFLAELADSAPPQAAVECVESVEITPVRERDDATRPPSFLIVESENSGAARPAIPPDIATCPACLAEITTPGERRHRYPFTNCTDCGPRLTIVENLPYDRDATSMAAFVMCPECRAEYENPLDRRFHAQPIACPACGPRLELLDASGAPLATDEPALDAAGGVLLEGGILALRGIGGFQLLADATGENAVLRLRERKRREAKPFAVMTVDLEAARELCTVSDDETRVLESPEAPILLLRRKGDAAGRIADAVAPGNPELGLMLPYTPLHHLLLRVVSRPVVCTSGNLSEEPMCTETGEAVQRLNGIADRFLTHDRPIVRAVDDSVARWKDGGVALLRRARGFAPRPLPVRGPDCTVLALGGHLKSTIALAVGGRVVVSSHIGDLESPGGRDLFARTVDDLLRFYQVTPEIIACDLHPDYPSTRHAELLAGRFAIPRISVQHHHAHAIACMTEHELEGEVLALVWDGTGFGTDGTIWGGECLACTVEGFRRVATLRPFRLPGGDAAVREPRRSALGLLHELDGPSAEPPVGLFESEETHALLAMLERGIHAPVTTSMGRLFDAVAALTALRKVSSFEAEAAMALEHAADDAPGKAAAYPMPVEKDRGPGGIAMIDWGPTVRAIVEDACQGASIGEISARFHDALANAALAAARIAGIERVVLSGGCFQNLRLEREVRSRLSAGGFRVFSHHGIPPNDGGIAVGQLRVAAARTAATRSAPGD